ncbi:hypothetical protein OG21DRAFT_1271740 [Imleria badia]|nr:hypothetical protein OG21DRAFT_1271740 [Imleria badia]
MDLRFNSTKWQCYVNERRNAPLPSSLTLHPSPVQSFPGVSFRQYHWQLINRGFMKICNVIFDSVSQHPRFFPFALWNAKPTVSAQYHLLMFLIARHLESSYGLVLHSRIQGLRSESLSYVCQSSTCRRGHWSICHPLNTFIIAVVRLLKVASRLFELVDEERVAVVEADMGKAETLEELFYKHFLLVDNPRGRLGRCKVY